MQLIQRNKDSAYLQYDKYVDYDNPIVAAKAKELAEGCKSSDEIIQACYYLSGMKFLTLTTAILRL